MILIRCIYVHLRWTVTSSLYLYTLCVIALYRDGRCRDCLESLIAGVHLVSIDILSSHSSRCYPKSRDNPLVEQSHSLGKRRIYAITLTCIPRYGVIISRCRGRARSSSPLTAARSSSLVSR